MSNSSKQPPSAPTEPEDRVHDLRLIDALSERYLAYALSTITSRSLPDVRDGLKPVHRRLLWAMRELRLDPKDPPKKSARVVGDVIGKFHPHGDVAVYDALVRLAQDFSQRYPLVDGQGNFGNIDGDNAAAMRYTEARMTDVAQMLMEGIDENAVDFRSTYDGRSIEPIVLPAAFPNLLANGSTGIAVGMATSIPPHNVAELCDAMRHLIKHREAGFETLAKLIPGPDFPTGGILSEDASVIEQAWKTGRGSFRLRAKWEKEELRLGQWQIAVTEIPWQVPKARIIEKIAALLGERKLTLLDDIRDESATDVRIILVPRSRTVEAEALMEQMFRHTELEVRIALNLNVLDRDGVPRVMDMREALLAWLDHRHEVLVRRASWKLERVRERLEVVAGYMIAFINLDKVIRIIRTEDEPSPVLQRSFKITEAQAEAILNLRLRALRKLDELALRKEQESLAATRDEMEKLLGDEGLRWKQIDNDIVAIKKAFGPNSSLGRRRTKIAEAPRVVVTSDDVDIVQENVTVVCSRKGWVRAMRGHGIDINTLKWKDGDDFATAFEATTTDKVIFADDQGRFYTLGVDKLPGGRGLGEPLSLMVDMPSGASIVKLLRFAADDKLLVAASDGRGFIVNSNDVRAQTRSGKQILVVGQDVTAVAVVPIAGDHVAVWGNNRKLLVFPVVQIPTMSRGRGVILQKYVDASLVGVISFDLADGLKWQQGERTRTERDLTTWLGNRAGAGRMAPRGFNI